MSSKALIGIDWGTTNLRVYHMDAAGRLVDCYRSGEGLLSVDDGDFAGRLTGVLARWSALQPPLESPLVACGMVGSRQGWAEAPYVPCPARLETLASHLMPVTLSDGVPVHIVPGLQFERHDGVMDVMRGEETVIIGAAAGERGLFCIPGTHAKWVRMDNDVVSSFATAMTGELFELLATKSILAKMLDASATFDSTSFKRGLVRSRSDDGVLQQLFSVRTSRLFDRISDSGATSYLSGLLIGNDVRSALASHDGTSVTIVGDGQLARCYAMALSAQGIASRTLSAEDAVVAGLIRIAGAAGLLH